MKRSIKWGASALVIGGMSASVNGQLIRPDAATASSEFSALYDAGNTIDGSGLPAGFGLADAHATYAANNHWTTRANQTIDQFATFSFNVPQTLGQFHFWNHRSNGVASNSFYEPVLYDLVFFDGPNGTGATLATLTSLSAQPNTEFSQTRVFDVVSNVRSVRFIVRATENSNASQYTGLAEVAFGPCAVPTFAGSGQPESHPACPGETVSFAAFPNGSGPFSYQWQWRADGSEPWLNILEGDNAGVGPGALFVAAGATLPGVSVFPGASGWPVGGRYQFRLQAVGACGTVESLPALLAIDPADIGSTGGEPGRDGVYDNNDFVVFIDLFFSQSPVADLGSVGGEFGPDGVYDNNDFIVFIDRFFSGCV